MFDRVVFSTLCLVITLGCGLAKADQPLEPIGGGGGTPFTARCAPGTMLTGLELSTGDDVDAIRAVCAVAYHPMQAGPATPHPFRYGGNGGGASYVLLCPDATPVVTGIYVRAEGRSTTIVNNVHLFCGLAGTATPGAVPGPAFDGPAVGSGFNIPTLDTQYCSEGTVAVGINGRSGIWVDALGLVCGAPTMTQDPNPGKVLGRLKPNKPAMEVPKPTTTASVGGIAPTVSPPTPVLASNNAVPTGAAILYGYGSNGVLTWYRHNGAASGAGLEVAGSWAQTKNMSDGWNNFKQVFAGGNGVIYGIAQDGRLIWYRHAAFRTGEAMNVAGAWDKPRAVSNDWANYRRVFAAGDGVIYAITQDGQLLWFRHLGAARGTPEWQGPKSLGGGWGAYEQVFSGGGGVIYAVRRDGVLQWTRHDGFINGANQWQRAHDVGRGWNGLRAAFSAGNGIIYTISADGILRWYRHNGYQDGLGLESPGSWSERADVGRGWNALTVAFAQF